MKIQTLLTRIVQTLSVLALAVPLSVRSQSSSYTNDVSDPVGLWSNSANWLDGTIANGAGNTATFSNSVAAVVRLDMDSSRTIGNLTFPGTAYTIYNATNDANILTLAGGTKPVITVATGNTATIQRAVIAGTGGMVIDGGGQLNFWKDVGDPANTLTGGIIITNGSTLQITATDINAEQPILTPALLGLGPITLANGTLNLRPPQHTSFSYGVVSNNLIVPTGMTGTVFNIVRYTGAAGDNSATAGDGLGGTLTGGGTLNFNIRYVRGNIVGDWSAFTGQINVVHDAVNDAFVHEFRWGVTNGLPNASVDLGGTLNFDLHYYRLMSNNVTFRIGALTGNNPTVRLLGGDTAGNGSTNTLIYDVGALRTDPATNDTFAGNIVNGVGPARLVKRGSGRLILTGTNNIYTGGTTIAAGQIQVGDGVNEVGTIGTSYITNNTALVFSRAGSLTVPGPISGSGVITNNGTAGSTIRLIGTNTYTGATYVNSGRLMVGTVSRSPATTYTVANSAGLGVVSMGNNQTLTNSSVTFGTGCTYDYDFGSAASPTATVVTNTGTVTLAGNVTVNIDGTGLTVGTITLLQYGTRSGPGSFVLGTLPDYVTSSTFNDDTANKRVTLTISVITDKTLRYVGDANGVWDIGNTANQIWVEQGTGNPTNYYDGARVKFDDSATGTTTITLGATVAPAGITVSNTTKAYRFIDPAQSFSIAGLGGLTKLGTNKLTIGDVLNNSYTAPTIIEAGILQVGDGTNNASLGSGTITNNAVLLLDNGGGLATLGQTYLNPIHGTGSVVQVNTNILSVPTVLSGPSTYSGGLTLKPATTIGYGNANAAGVGGGLTVEKALVLLTANPAATIGTINIVSNGTFTTTANRNIDANFAVEANETVVFDKPAAILITLTADINTGIFGRIVSTNAGNIRFNSGSPGVCFGSSNAVFELATAGAGVQPRNASVNYLGAVEGIGQLGAQQTGGGSITYNVGGLNTDNVFQGAIVDDVGLLRFTGITKVGTGTWSLTNVNMAYRGITRVNSGKLALQGTTSPNQSTNIMVAAPGILDVSLRTDGTLTLGSSSTNQALMGDGTIIGNVVLNSSARLQPGFSIGILTNTGTFTIGGVSTFELDGSTTNSDRIVAPTINYGGTLVLTNISTVVGTKTYKLFQGSLSGSFSTIVTQAVAGVTWDTSTLNTAGTVTLVGSVATSSTNITVTTSGGTNLTLSWPDSHKGWTIETNAVGLPTTNWFPVPNSQLTNQIILNIDKTRTNALFYRMRL